MLDKSQHMKNLYKALSDLERPLQCLVTRRYIDPQYTKVDIHEAIIKRNAGGKQWQEDHYTWLFSIPNCTLLDAEAHALFGQYTIVRALHVWKRLLQGYDISAWVRQYPTILGTIPFNMIASIQEAYARKDALIAARGVDGKFPRDVLIWPATDEIWHYAGENESIASQDIWSFIQ